MPDLKLGIELVPGPLWEQSLYRLAKRSVWDKLRKSIYQTTDHHCAVCGASGRLYCHEIWDYDDTAHVARLTGFRPICDACNAVTHWGRTSNMVKGGELRPTALEETIEHFCRVNNCSRETFEAHEKEAIARWRQRSKWTDWKIDWGAYASMLPRAD